MESEIALRILLKTIPEVTLKIQFFRIFSKEVLEDFSKESLFQFLEGAVKNIFFLKLLDLLFLGNYWCFFSKVKFQILIASQVTK